MVGHGIVVECTKQHSIRGTGLPYFHAGSISNVLPHTASFFASFHLLYLPLGHVIQFQKYSELYESNSASMQVHAHLQRYFSNNALNHRKIAVIR